MASCSAEMLSSREAVEKLMMVCKNIQKNQELVDTAVKIRYNADVVHNCACQEDNTIRCQTRKERDRSSSRLSVTAGSGPRL